MDRFQHEAIERGMSASGILAWAFLPDLSKVLYVSAETSHEVVALSESSVTDVTGVELIDLPPLVSRTDPHNLPFFDGVFDLAFSGNLEETLLLLRFVAEIERTVRFGGSAGLVWWSLRSAVTRRWSRLLEIPCFLTGLDTSSCWAIKSSSLHLLTLQLGP
ncbi:hypothetical protein NL676_021212 [Syzygium grande]|nr:hypothetical protein NL676_021212 [Syzygium grande]